MAEEAQLVAYHNLMLLCPTCHTIVDGAAHEYTADILRGWKVEHESRLSEILGVARFGSREQARAHIIQLLEENRTIWDHYGPESPDAWKPETSTIWATEVKDVVLPNNSRIKMLLEMNVHLLINPDEHRAVGEFRAHARALELRHIAGVINPAAPRFPPALNDIFLTNAEDQYA